MFAHSLFLSPRGDFGEVIGAVFLHFSGATFRLKFFTFK